MTVIEKINEINDIIKEIFDFTQTNEKVKTDFDEYLATIGARNISLNQMEKSFCHTFLNAELTTNLF